MTAAFDVSIDGRECHDVLHGHDGTNVDIRVSITGHDEVELSLVSNSIAVYVPNLRVVSLRDLSHIFQAAYDVLKNARK